jgi:hypothetical protein
VVPPLFFAAGPQKEFFVKYGFLNGHKVAECQDAQLHLMARFKRERTVDEWRDSDAETEENGPASGADGGTAKQPETQAVPAGGNAPTSDDTGGTAPQGESGNGGPTSKPPTKAELIAEAQALGIALTGKEKNADIAALIEAAKAEVSAIFPEDPQGESGNGGDGNGAKSE